MKQWMILTNSSFNCKGVSGEIAAYSFADRVPSISLAWGNSPKELDYVEFPPELFLQGVARRRFLERNGASWFVPMVERMAAGEKVSLEEIEAAYREHNDGKEMPKGTWGELFRDGKV